MNRQSKRFSPSRWSQYLVPALLVILGLALLATILVVALAVLGFTPGI
ncbi:MAG TPA: hypothetical protein VE136_09985 [Anaerolineales bacterium]|jgi:hypothetical protein|nr:hypothetical protein [Anaerolineales bacterium]